MRYSFRQRTAMQNHRIVYIRKVERQQERLLQTLKREKVHTIIELLLILSQLETDNVYGGLLVKTLKFGKPLVPLERSTD